MKNEPEVLPCDGKLAFDTKRQAEAEATATQWRHGSLVKAYNCKYCQLWHLASANSSIQ